MGKKKIMSTKITSPSAKPIFHHVASVDLSDEK